MNTERSKSAYLMVLTTLVVFFVAGSVWASGQEIRATQEALQSRGYDPGPIDGLMGRRTAEALKEFQRNANLPITGRLDKETAEALGVTLMLTAVATPAAAGKLVIPFEDLEPYWSGWKRRKRTEDLGVFCKRGDGQTSIGVLISVSRLIAFDSYGLPVAPTNSGAKIIFETEGCKYSWVNGIVIQADDRMVFEVQENLGLVHLSGGGVVTLKNGEDVVVR